MVPVKIIALTITSDTNGLGNHIFSLCECQLYVLTEVLFIYDSLM